MYQELIDRATAAGFHQYEVANFARDPIRSGNCNPEAGTPAIPSRASRHNVNYWRGGYFHGLGPSATGYVRGVRTKNWANTQLYCEQLEKGKRAVESKEELSPLARAGETAAFGLRMNVGWGFQEFECATGYDLRREWQRDMAGLVEQGWGFLSASHFRLTPQGLRFADAAAEMFLR
jgi:oxygen-independent coproporphyrinogen-3 oxidase